MTITINIIISVNCRGQSNTINNLEKYYELSYSNDSLKYQTLFLKIFPQSFETFDSIYGYKDKPMPLYNVYEKHLNLFCNLSKISKNDYYDKLISLSIRGYWGADAINVLQSCVIKHVLQNPRLIIKKLNNYNEEEIKSFWKFLIDSAHPDDKEIINRYDNLYTKLKVIDLKHAQYLKLEYNNLRFNK